jgi:hypothetical protein
MTSIRLFVIAGIGDIIRRNGSDAVVVLKQCGLYAQTGAEVLKKKRKKPEIILRADKG